MVASTDRSKKPLLTFDRPGEIARGRDAVPVEPGNFFPPRRLLARKPPNSGRGSDLTPRTVFSGCPLANLST